MPKEPINIVQSQVPNLLGQAEVNFIKNDFDALIWKKGFRVIWEKSIRCPCKIESSDNLYSCLNCGGSGYIFINPVETRMVLQGISNNTKYSNWSEETIGTVKITTRDIDKIGFMDRLTLIDSETMFSEVVYPKFTKEQLRVKSFYNIKRLFQVFRFDSDKKPLVLLIEGQDYTLNKDNVIDAKAKE